MTKLLKSLTVIVLITGSVANATAWRQKPQSNKITSQHHSVSTTNEDAEDIASKLFNNTIKIDPNYWLNKNITNYQSQFNTAVVKDGILTEAETQYVSWGALNINFAGWFYNQGAFTVKKDGAVATGHFNVDADTGETTVQIAQKIANATNLKFNYDYWNNKVIQNYLPQLQNIFVNDHILTKTEASLVRSVVKPTNINKAGEIPFTVNVNDNKTNTNATVQINVVNDGNSAQAIANTINNKGYGLKVNTAGQYADSSYIMKNWTNLLTANYGVSADDADHITLPHVKLANDNPKTTATVKKDGQIFTANVDLECKTGPYIYYYIVNNNYVQLYVNLNAQLLSYLKTYFVGETYHDDLKYFYNMLDDNQDHQHLPDYKGKYLIPWGNRLDQNMDTYGNTGDTTGLVIKYEADTSVSSIGEFANQFHSAVMNSNNYLTVMFEWHYYMPNIFENNYEITQWKFF